MFCVFMVMKKVSRSDITCGGRCRGLGDDSPTSFGKHRHRSWTETRPRMEEEARKLLEEGIRKKLISPGKGELSTFPDGTKVKAKY